MLQFPRPPTLAIFIAKITNIFQDADLNSGNEGAQDEDIEDKDMEDEDEAEEYEEMDVGGRKARKSTELPGRPMATLTTVSKPSYI